MNDDSRRFSVRRTLALLIGLGGSLCAFEAAGDSLDEAPIEVLVVDILVDDVAVLDAKGNFLKAIPRSALVPKGERVRLTVLAIADNGAVKVQTSSAKTIWLDRFDVVLNLDGASQTVICDTLRKGRDAKGKNHATMGIGNGCQGR